MANSFLTASWVCRKSLILLHQKSNLAGRANRNYQDQFGPVDGVPVGTSINVRLPFKYIGRTGNAMSAENSVQRSVALPINNQIGVDINFSSIERAQDLGSFEEQVLEPAIAQVAAKIEATVGALTLQIPKLVGTYSTSISMSQLMAARRLLTEALAPEDMLRTLTANPQAHEEFVVNNASLFNPETSISEQFLEGLIAERVAGCTAFENTKLTNYTVGTYASTSTFFTVSGTNGNSGVGNAFASTTSLVVSGLGSTDTVAAGEVITIVGVDDVDPETKADLGRTKQFVVTSTVTASAGNATLVISPAIIYGGAYQNCSAAAVDGKHVTLSVAGSALLSTASAQLVKQSIMWHRDAILFVCVPMFDLSSTVKWTAREEYDGFSMRVAQIYDVDNDFLPCRIDTLSGTTVGDGSLAVRLAHQPTTN
jgi:P22 coat protein - gene protein 5